MRPAMYRKHLEEKGFEAFRDARKTPGMLSAVSGMTSVAGTNAHSRQMTPSPKNHASPSGMGGMGAGLFNIPDGISNAGSKA